MGSLRADGQRTLSNDRLSTVTVGGALKSTYTYNGLEQTAIRVATNMTPSGTTHFIYDRAGNLIAETAGGGATGATGTVREYIWLPEAEIAPTFGSRTVVGMGIAKDCKVANVLAKKSAQAKLKCQPKHTVSCKTTR